MDVHVLAKENCVVEFLAGTEILRTFLHQEGINTFIGCGKPHPHGLESVRAEQCLTDCRRLGAAF